MNYTPVRFHLVQAILADPAGEWTIREMTNRVAAKVRVPSGTVQDSLYSMMADNLLEAVPFQPDNALTLRLRHDMTNPNGPLATATQRLARLLNSWHGQHESSIAYLPDLGEER